MELANKLRKKVTVGCETADDKLIEEVGKIFDYQNDDIDVYIYPNDLKKIEEIEGKIYTIREEENLVGCALVEFIDFEKLNDKEQIEDGTPVTVISALQIAEDKQYSGYGKRLAETIESETDRTIILKTVWRTYRFWRDKMGYEPIEIEDEDDQTWLFKRKEKNLD